LTKNDGGFSTGMGLATHHFGVVLPSLKLTTKAPENRPSHVRVTPFFGLNHKKMWFDLILLPHHIVFHPKQQTY